MRHSDFVVLSFLFLARFISMLLMGVLLWLLEIAEEENTRLSSTEAGEIPLPLYTEAGGGCVQRRCVWGGARGNPARPRSATPRCKALESAPVFPAPCGLVASGLANFQLFSASGDQIFLINNKRFCWDQGCFPPSPCKPGQHKPRALAFQGTSYYGGQESPSRWVRPILSSPVTSVLTFKAGEETR